MIFNRLEFRDLDGNDIIGIEQRQELWIPPLVLSNTEDNKILENDMKTTINILKRGKYSLNDKTEVNEAAVFDGKENMIRYEREYHSHILCDYNLRLYPFDEQICTIDVEIPAMIAEFIQLTPKYTENLGVSELIQFVIEKIEIEATRNNSLVQCKIYLKRIPWSHIASVYIPCTCVLVMCLSTLYIDKSHFEATIMVSLTAMLVMYTLYQSIADSMPKTAYLKFLDYWLLYGMILPFVVFSILVIWELMDQNPKTYPRSVEKLHKKPSEKSILRHARCILPTITIFFIIIYTLAAMIVYFNGHQFV